MKEEESRLIIKNNSSILLFDVATIGFKFDCPDCGNKVMTDWEVDVPYPDYSADSASDSENSEFTGAQCAKCEKEFDIQIINGHSGGWINIDGLDDNADVEAMMTSIPPDYELDASLSNTEYKETFDSSLANIRQLSNISISDNEQVRLLLGNLYVSVITAMETYLSDAFLNIVDKRGTNYLRQFVGAFKKYQDKKIKLSELFDFHESIKQDALKEIRDLTFHNIEQSKYLFGKVLNVDFPDELGELFKIVEIRHDLVHRNGKTKEGNDISIDKATFNGMTNTISDFVEFIDNQIIEK